MDGAALATDLDVAIIGLGPVGHVMAALMSPSAIGSACSIASRRSTSRRGSDISTTRSCASFNAAGQVLIHFDWSRPETTGWHPHYLFCQPDLDAILAGKPGASSMVGVV